MLIGRVSTTSLAKRTYTISYPWLQEGERIASVTASVTPSDGLFTVSEVVVIGDGTRISFSASGNNAAVNGTEYRATIVISTDTGQINDDCVIFMIDCGGCC